MNDRYRMLLVASLVVFLALQGFAALSQGDGGWAGEYGFPAAIVDFFDVSF